MSYKYFFKPLIDFMFGLGAFILFLPVFLIVAILLAIVNRGPVFFFQERAGKAGKIFNIIKFKTMNDRTDGKGNLLSDSIRLTKIGKIVRRYSLDELPQLINIIKGDMSLIGPRPFLAEYLDIYTPYEKQRLILKPGITGWAQVNGRNLITWKEKFALDIWYVNHVSLSLDIKILFLTLINVLKAEGIDNGKDQEVEKFNGYN